MKFLHKILFRYLINIMADDNKNIIKFSIKHVEKKDVKNKSLIKNFEGFDYVKTDVDLNDKPFIRQNLIEYSSKCHYMVRVMREKHNRVYLYNYYVSQADLGRFLSKFDNGEFDGTVIEVEKYIPEDLA